ncbi:MAG: 6,7-dimethyl-8-ribityllumazine synthase [Cyanobacteria bacterium REEB65]|nr:6,7-dimethyl-8-ribityllumazine synthase [Cyanobacteria bacterium REEB65]
MPTILSAPLLAANKRFAIAAARFNQLVTDPLIAGAIDTLVRHGAHPDDITIAWVPGAFELPAAARRLARPGSPFAAVICLGCVIRGQTPHFDYVASGAATGIAQAGAQSDVPVIFGVLTTETLEQAVDRAGAKAGNKGADAALAAIEMANLLPMLP